MSTDEIRALPDGREAVITEISTPQTNSFT